MLVILGVIFAIFIGLVIYSLCYVASLDDRAIEQRELEEYIRNHRK